MRIGFKSKKKDADSSLPEGSDVLPPHKTIIKTEPLLALEKGYLVLALDHEFVDIPSWVKWSPDEQIMSISQMNGDIDEVRIVIKQKYIDKLVEAKKLLLVSSQGDEKISHYVPFLA